MFVSPACVVIVTEPVLPMVMLVAVVANGTSRSVQPVIGSFHDVALDWRVWNCSSSAAPETVVLGITNAEPPLSVAYSVKPAITSGARTDVPSTSIATSALLLLKLEPPP